MSFLFPKAPKMPAVPPPPPIPQAGTSAMDLAQQQAQQRAGFQKTILTGDLEPKPTGKKKLLGGG
jgi:hypothetical protein